MPNVYCTDEEYAYYMGYTDRIRPSYSNVELIDQSIGDLLQGEKFVRHDAVSVYKPQPSRLSHNPSVAPCSVGFTPKVIGGEFNSKIPITTMSDHSLMNPKDGAMVVTDEPFHMRLMTKFHPDETNHWDYFAASGVKVFSLGYRKGPAISENCQTISQRYRIELQHGAEYGHIQFIQRAKLGGFNTRGNYPYGSILNFYVLRGEYNKASSIGKVCSPPVLPIRPTSLQTFVPLQIQQKMQLILPTSFQIKSFRESSVSAVKLCDKFRSDTNSHYCFYYKRMHSSIDSFPIVFSGKKTSTRGMVVITPIESRERKDYAVIYSPLDKLVVNINHIDGIILRMTSNKLQCASTGYLDRNRRLQIESKYRFYCPISNQDLYDVRLKITDKSLKNIQIINLFHSNDCQTKNA